MLYLLLPAAFGLWLGIFSAYRQRAFIAILVGLVPIAIALISLFAPTLFVVGFSEGVTLSSFGEMYNALPEIAQSGLIIFPASIFVGRLGAWLWIHFGKHKTETKQERKQRIMKLHGYKDGMFD